jgi:transcriptional regulator with XRE-family HTH domain
MRLETEFAHAMRRAGLKQKTVAKMVGKSRYTVARWMHGDAEAPPYAWTIVRQAERINQLAANN